MNRSVTALCVAHLIGNALLLLLGYYWLGLAESDAAHLAWSAAVVVIFLVAGLWLHGTALVQFNPDQPVTFRQAAVSASRALAPLFALAAMALSVYGMLTYWHDSFAHKAFVIGSYATMRLRKPVPPSGIMRAFWIFIWIVRWIVIPVLLLPLAAHVATRGWRGFRMSAFRRATQPLWWVQACALALVAIFVPLKLITWTPKVEGFPVQMLSFIIRFSIGYLLFVAGLLALEFSTSRGRPRFSQLKTASSP